MPELKLLSLNLSALSMCIAIAILHFIAVFS